jgi:hypothetical protein
MKKSKHKTGRTAKTSGTKASYTSKKHSSGPNRDKLGRGQMFLYITDFDEIFEPSDAKRKHQKGPLSFTKSLVTIHFLSKPAEIRFIERMKILKSHSKRHLLRSVFEDLKNWTAAKYLGPRGFLITADLQPASCEYLAVHLDHVSIEDLEKAIPILEEIGLLETVTFDHVPDTDGRSRMQPDTAGRKRKPLNKSNGKGKSKSKDRSAKSNIKSKNKSTKTNNNRQTNKVKQQATQTPATTPEPIRPTQSEAGGSVIPFTGPLGSAKHKRSEANKLGDVAAGILHRYDNVSQSFAVEVYRGLGLPSPLDSKQAARELGAFRSCISKARLDLPPPDFQELMNRAIAEAERMKKYWRNRPGKPAAVWCKVFGDMVAKAKSRKAM